MRKKLRLYTQWLQLVGEHPGKASVFYQEHATAIDEAERAVAGVLARDKANRFRPSFLP